MDFYEMSNEERYTALCKDYEEKNEEAYAKMGEAIKRQVQAKIEYAVNAYKKGELESARERAAVLNGFLEALSFTNGLTIDECGRLMEYLTFRCKIMCDIVEASDNQGKGK